MTQFLIIVVAFALLMKSADYLVISASNLGRHFGISEIVIGLTIVAFGTSSPELAVNAIAAIEGHSGITVGNVLGSNIVNICLGLGIAAILIPLTVERSTVRFHLPVLLVGTLLLFLLGSTGIRWLQPSASYNLTRWDGIILLVLFGLYLWQAYVIAHKAGSVATAVAADEPERRGPLFEVGRLVVAGVLLFVSGEMIVSSADTLARSFGIPESVIGASIVAIGTSIPDVATTIVATRRGKNDIAVGNIVGSNLFNTFWILGLSAILSKEPLPMSGELLPDLFIMTAITLFLAVAALATKRISRWQGILMVLAYGVYTAYLISKV